MPLLTDLVNHTITSGIVPERLKFGQVTPIFKKNDPMDKANHRPVTLLPVHSKIYEKVLAEQFSEHFEGIFDKYLCAFRKGHGCQTTLLRLIEDWKEAMEKSHYVAAVLMDLSKAFDCFPHDVLLCKLSAYGLSSGAVNLMASYLSNRKQRIKIGNIFSSWTEIHKGSILGPLLFNVFMINDIFYSIVRGTLYNYADDNTLSFHSPDYNELISILQTESEILIDWFFSNQMKANPDKFQAVAIGLKTHKMSPVFKVGNVDIAEDVVKLLGVDIDFNLTFDNHIQNICKKAGQQLNVQRRIGKNLCKLSRMTIFHTFIISNFNFCPLSWHFCSKSNTNKIEKIQERALRFVYDDYNSLYTELLSKACLPILETRRIRTMAIETFKILNGLAPPVLSDLLIIIIMYVYLYFLRTSEDSHIQYNTNEQNT